MVFHSFQIFLYTVPIRFGAKKKKKEQNFLRRLNEKNLMKGLFIEVVDKL